MNRPCYFTVLVAMDNARDSAHSDWGLSTLMGTPDPVKIDALEFAYRMATEVYRRFDEVDWRDCGCSECTRRIL